MEPNNNFTTSDDGKTAGIISYFSIIGWLIAFFAIHKDKKTDLGSYQLRQTLLLHIAWMAFHYFFRFLFAALFYSSDSFSGFIGLGTLVGIIDLGFVVLWIIGFIGAVNGEKKPIPLIGEKAQSVFSTI